MRRTLWPECTPRRNAAEMRAFLGDARRYAVFLAVRPDGTYAGFVEVSLRPNYRMGDHPPIGYLEGLFVDGRVRRQGIGRALVAVAEGWARERGVTEMGSDAFPWNWRSRAAHRSYGYRERERLVIFQKPLRAPRRAPRVRR